MRISIKPYPNPGQNFVCYSRDPLTGELKEVKEWTRGSGHSFDPETNILTFNNEHVRQYQKKVWLVLTPISDPPGESFKVVDYQHDHD